MGSAYLDIVNSKIDSEKVLLNDISQELWKNPELCFEEKHAHDFLTGVLRDQGFRVQPNYILDTAFRAEYDSGIEGPTIAILCEYDALPEIGHACGHNLIAEAGIGAGLGIKAAMEIHKNIPGKVVILGCPAEERGGGKIHLIDKGAFKDIDVAMMVHPGSIDDVCPQFLIRRQVDVCYTGLESHASATPWDGRNALDAAVACYSNIALLRQHIKPTCRIHGGPTVAVLCEYDALPEIGHACGHNLIAEAGIGAGLAIKAAMKVHKNVRGKVVIIGTPAAEDGGGKIRLINQGAFNDIDVAMMVHPSSIDYLFPHFIAARRVDVRYIGQEAHPCAYPWEGRNALDAAVACYNNIALLRQHIKPTCKIHGIISNGGNMPNIIPAASELKFLFRAPTNKDLEDLREKIDQCFRTAAMATGCEVLIEYKPSLSCDGLISNKLLAELYGKFSESHGVKFTDGNSEITRTVSSSDVGNVSRIIPTIQPLYSIGTDAINHSRRFTAASGAPEAQIPTLVAAKSMALTALEVMTNRSLLSSIKDRFSEDMENGNQGQI